MPANRRDLLVLGGVGLAATAAGSLLGPLAIQSRSGVPDLLGTRFPDFDGHSRRLLEWPRTILVCNFWATWCAPCLEEIPLLVDFRTKYVHKGVEVVGIGIDHVVKMREFAAKLRIPYPLLVGSIESIDLTRRLGNKTGGLPYTVVLDRSGGLVVQKVGAVLAGELDEMVARLMR